MNREGIRKPAWFAYKYLHALKGNGVALADGQAMAAVDGKRIAALVWDWQQPVQTLSNKPFYTRLLPASPSREARLHFSGVTRGDYRLQLRKTGYRINDPMSLYIDMGMPTSLSAAQLQSLQEATADKPIVDRIVKIDVKGVADIAVPMRSNDIILVTLEPA